MHIYTSVEHPKWSFFGKILKAVNYFCKAPFWMYDWVLDTPLEDFVQDASRKELAIAPVVECLITTAWLKYY